jgi:hypothetical protein
MSNPRAIKGPNTPTITATLEAYITSVFETYDDGVIKTPEDLKKAVEAVKPDDVGARWRASRSRFVSLRQEIRIFHCKRVLLEMKRRRTTKYAVAYDCTRKQPGCVLLQAAMGGTVPRSLFHDLFPAETWLVGLTDDMQLISTTEEQLRKVASITKTRREDR